MARLTQVMAADPVARHIVAMPESKPVTVAPPTRRVQDRARHPRLARELKTIHAMLRIYCHDLHAEDRGLCAGCTALMNYATRRLDRCVFGDDKPTCANCTVHCYSAAMREQVRSVMRYAGPRMLTRHPILALAHVIDGRRPAPELPRPAQRVAPAAEPAPSDRA
jgi:Nitrous oxide-stimulated promoter